MKIFILFLCFFIYINCSKKQEIVKEEKVFEMHQMSEMSVLMEQMFVDNMRLKEKIVQKKSLGKFNDYFLKIHTSKFTDSTDNNEHFKKNAKLFIASQKSIFVDVLHAKANFNKMVNACITCHEGNCGGPIVKIKKLYIVKL